MADVRLVFSAVQGDFDRAFRAIYQPIAAAATGAVNDAAAQVKSEGRANIAAGGFGKNWQNALQVEVYPRSGVSANAVAFAHHKIPYADVFEYGAQIRGKPLLWVPITGTPARVGGHRLTPRVFTQQIGPLLLLSSKNRNKPPLLASPITGRHGTKITVAKLRRGQSRLGLGTERLQPVFVGLSQVTIRQRFNLHAVFQHAAEGLADGYLRNLKPDG
jgi:hypothetical protein